jgi:hypothetical protein
MEDRMHRIPAIVALVAVAGCATVNMPANVRTAPSLVGGSPTIDGIDFSYNNGAQASFAVLQRCVATNVTNSAVTLTDAAGSYLTPRATAYRTSGNAQTIQGGNVITYADASQQALVAHGNATSGAAAGGLTINIISFDLHAASTPGRTQLQFVNITQAQKATGQSVNDGFSPIGTHSGAHPMQAYDTLQNLAERIKTCISG